MTAIGLPVPLVLLLRRLFNAFSAFSITQAYITSRWSLNSEAHNNGLRNDESILLDAEEKGEQLLVQQGSSWDLLKHLRHIPWSQRLPSRSIFERAQDLVENTRLRIRRTKSPADPPHSPPDRESSIHQLISHPTLFDPVRAPRHPIVLCHGLYGFDVRGPETFPKLRLHYWSNVLHILRKRVGAEVVVAGVPGTGSIASRAERMDLFLREHVKGREINFLAHSMGGLDCRHLITHIQPQEYTPLSLTSLSVPHRGSPFMDWCLANIGIGSPRPFPFPSSNSSASCADAASPIPNPIPYSLKSPLLSRRPRLADSPESQGITIAMLPSSFTSMILSLIDSPAYSNLTTSFLRDKFNLFTPDKAGVRYFSVAARTTKMSIWHPLWLPKLIIDAAEEQEAVALQTQGSQMSSYQQDVTVSYPGIDSGTGPDPDRGNDGLVTVSSAKWGEHLGTMEGCDHWEMRGARGLGTEWEEGLGKSWRDWVGTWKESDRRTAETSGTKNNGKVKDWATRNDLASRFDLERFYVALSRKLYDEGL